MTDTTSNPTNLTRPAKMLDADSPACQSAADCSVAMHEIGWIKARATAIDGQTEADIARLKQLAEQRKVVRGVAFADRVEALTAAIIAFARASRDVLITGKKKSANLTHGAIKFRDASERVVVSDEAAVKAQADELQQKLARWLQRQKVGDVPASELFSAKVSFSATTALAATKAGRVSAAKLESLGLSIDTPDESVTVAPAAYVEGIA